jgi:hypothetical protein
VKGQAFYEVAAQVLPVLLLVLVIESRFFARASTRFERIMAGTLFAWIAFAEFLALLALRREKALDWPGEATVWLALAGEALLIGVSPLVWPEE